MTKKLHTILISLVIFSLVIGCSAPGTGPVVVTATAEPTSSAPPRMPPPGIEDTNTPVAESTPVSIVSIPSTTNVAECKLPDRLLDSPYN